MKLEVDCKKVFDMYDILVDDFQMKVPEDISWLRWSCFRGPKDVHDSIRECHEDLAETMKKFFR